MLHTDFERDAAMQPISRDHGVLLVLVQRLQKAASFSKQDQLSLRTEIGARHAALVEQYLNDEQVALSKINISNLLSNEIADQHNKISEGIKQLVAKPAEDLKSNDFETLANVIDEHVRWDEREVLPYLQKRMSDEERKALAQATSEIESSRLRPIRELHRSIALNKSEGQARTCTCADYDSQEKS